MTASASELAWAEKFRASNSSWYCDDCTYRHFSATDACVNCVEAAYEEAAEFQLSYEEENGYDNDREDY